MPPSLKAERLVKKILPLLLAATCASAQTADTQTLAQVMQRLDALEKENRRLSGELKSLRHELAGARPPEAPSVEERVDVAEKRVAEQAQTKVESSQKFPLSINGMLLFNAFSSSQAASAAYSSYSSLLSGPASAGATVGQSIVGLRYEGPALPGKGRVNGSLTMDFWGAWSASNNTGWFRVREADLSMEWKRRTISFGQMKPLISPLQPSSLAEVGVSPLAGAGNLWYWLPQVRYEERLRFNSRSGLNLQASLIQTNEMANTVTSYNSALQRARPGGEGRAAFWRSFDETRRVEFGAGFHASTSHVGGVSIPSRIASFDWVIRPAAKLQLTGGFYRGRNVASLGSLGNGFLLLKNGAARAVETSAGWNQLAVPLTGRLTLNLFGGIESDNGSYAITRNFTYAGNALYRFGPNVVLGVEALQSRLGFYGGSRLLVNHYDLALAYIF